MFRQQNRQHQTTQPSGICVHPNGHIDVRDCPRLAESTTHDSDNEVGNNNDDSAVDFDCAHNDNVFDNDNTNVTRMFIGIRDWIGTVRSSSLSHK